jgi:hypothetical protein
MAKKRKSQQSETPSSNKKRQQQGGKPHKVRRNIHSSFYPPKHNSSTLAFPLGCTRSNCTQ